MALPLSILLWLPAALGLLALLAPGGAAPRILGLFGAFAALAFAIVAVVDFDSSATGLQYVTDDTWIRALGIHYKLGLDGLNLFIVLLATILFAASTAWACSQDLDRPGTYLFHLGVAETAVLGALLAQDLALFVAFFDLMLVPFFFLTGIYGPQRTRAAAVTKLVIYTLVGSLLMLAAAIATGVLSAQQSGGSVSFVLSDLHANQLSHHSQDWIFLCFAAAFLVKMPSFPLHGWMPDGYTNMPLPVLAVFSGVLSKVAAYGFLRIVTQLFPYASVHYQTLMLVIALCSIVYGSAMAFTTTNVRLILGYSSVAQLGFITLGVFALNRQGAQGAILQSFNHGLVVAPAFFIAGLMAARAKGSEDIRDMGGIALRAPILATLFLVVAFANLAMPGSSNFAGEFLILLGVFNAKVAIAAIAFTGVALASVYSLRLFIRVVHNRVGADVESRELGLRDAVVLVPLVLAILALALYPQLPLHKGQSGIDRSVTDAQALIAPPPAEAAVPATALPAGTPGATAAPGTAGAAAPPTQTQEVPTP